MSEATITNALLRCTREDRLAAESFELVRDDLGIWVYELPENFEDIIDAVSEISPLLRQLSNGGSDYVLHLAATIEIGRRLSIPCRLAELSVECGFSIEVVSTP